MSVLRALGVLLLCAASACSFDPNADKAAPQQVVARPENWKEDSAFLSPPVLQHPIYACATSVVVQGFAPGANIEVLADGAPIGAMQSQQSGGQLINVNVAFTAGQRITARQTLDGATSGASNTVAVTSHAEDFPNGLPAPRISPASCYECGRALSIADVIPGSRVRIYMEKARAGGGFDPVAQIGETTGSSYAIVTTPFTRDSRVHVTSSICRDTSPPSATEIVQAQPASIPTPTLDPVHEGVQIVVARGPNGTEPLNGATIDAFSDPGMVRVGGQPAPGGVGQQVMLNATASTKHTFRPTQALCGRSAPGNPVGVVPCSNQPPARIRAPMPGDTQIEATEYIPGARILVFANGVEIGDGGPPIVTLRRPVISGETISVLQRVGRCDSRTVHQVRIDCPLGGDASACAADWPAFRHDALRSGAQPIISALADPYQVKKLEVAWRFPANGSVGAFRASPVVRGGRVFVGSSDGHLYALDTATGAVVWQYPASGQPALTSTFVNGPSSEGIAASAYVAPDPTRGDMVIFAAPDPSLGAHLGSGRFFALRASDGGEIWKSPELARVTGTTRGAASELHEQFGSSSPLVFNGRVYGGIANRHPIQRGRMVAVNLADGQPAAGFSFQATSTRGGGIGSAAAGGLEGGGVYATTGNVRCWNGACQRAPSTNHGLSLLRLNAGSGALEWKLQPVPFAMDDGSDWATGVNLLASSCGPVALSTMNDGWSYAVRAQSDSRSANLLWQFPNAGVPFGPGDRTAHGASRYRNAGAVWNDVFFTETGGEGVLSDAAAGLGRLHALNVCGGAGRVRWTADIPGVSTGASNQLGSPSVTRGIVFIGASDGRLIALADPTRWPAQGSRCSRPDIPNAHCAANGYALVPIPTVLRDIALGAGRISGEPALAGDSVFVATEGGVVFMLRPKS